MNRADERETEIKTLRERLSRLCEASLRINESLDFATVLQGVVDSARSLAGAKYGVIVHLDDYGRVQDCLASGMTPDETGKVFDFPEGDRLFDCLGKIEAPLRLRDFHRYTRSLGLPEFRPPVPVSPRLSFLATPIRHRGERVGIFFLGEKEGGRAFSVEDEETLVMFASQAALAIGNARRYRDEQRTRADLEALTKTSPVGVVVFDPRTGAVISMNREVAKIIDGLRIENRDPEDFLNVLTVRRGDGREMSFEELSVAQVISGGAPALDMAEMMQFFRIINRHADEMSGLVNDLLDVARIRTGMLQVNPEPSQVTDLVDQARNTFLCGGGSDRLRIELAPELPPVSADTRGTFN